MRRPDVSRSILLISVVCLGFFQCSITFGQSISKEISSAYTIKQTSHDITVMKGTEKVFSAIALASAQNVDLRKSINASYSGLKTVPPLTFRHEFEVLSLVGPYLALQHSLDFSSPFFMSGQGSTGLITIDLRKRAFGFDPDQPLRISGSNAGAFVNLRDFFGEADLVNAISKVVSDQTSAPGNPSQPLVSAFQALSQRLMPQNCSADERIGLFNFAIQKVDYPMITVALGLSGGSTACRSVLRTADISLRFEMLAASRSGDIPPHFVHAAPRAKVQINETLRSH